MRRALAARVLALGVALASAPAFAQGCPRSERVVSINPSLTAVLVALGAQDRLVGVDDYSARQQPDLAHLPTVGGLYDTSLEALAALGPDLVVLVPSLEQRGVRDGLDRLDVPWRAFDPQRFEEVLETIEQLGACVGHEDAARERISAIRRARARIESERRSRPRLRGVLVITRDPLFVVGGGTFIDEMLEAVGVENLGRTLEGSYPRTSLEWLVAAQPEIIVDADAAGDARSFWARWPSLPAARDGRIASIPQGVATLPGPHLDRGLDLLARAVDAAREPR